MSIYTTTTLIHEEEALRRNLIRMQKVRDEGGNWCKEEEEEKTKRVTGRKERFFSTLQIEFIPVDNYFSSIYLTKNLEQQRLL